MRRSSIVWPVVVAINVGVAMTGLCLVAAFAWRWTFPTAFVPLALWVGSVYACAMTFWAFDEGLHWTRR